MSLPKDKAGYMAIKKSVAGKQGQYLAGQGLLYGRDSNAQNFRFQSLLLLLTFCDIDPLRPQPHVKEGWYPLQNQPLVTPTAVLHITASQLDPFLSTGTESIF